MTWNSNFGGKVENGHSVLETAFRKGSEELCGFLGDYENMKQKQLMKK